MRSRNLKPEFFTDKKIAKLGAKSALIYQALWILADDGGVCRCDPDYVKGALFYLWPDITTADIAAALLEYSRSTRVVLYAVSDELYAEIKSFGRHQKPNHPSKFRYLHNGEALTEEATVALLESYGSTTPLVPVLVPVPVPVSSGSSKTLSHCLKKTRRGKKPVETDLGLPEANGTAPDNWPAQFGDWWNANVGAVEYGLVGKKLKPAHKQFGLTRLLAGAAVYNDPQEGPPRKNFPDFAGNCAFWVSLAEMPMFDADGNDTLRLKRLPPVTPRWNGAR